MRLLSGQVRNQQLLSSEYSKYREVSCGVLLVACTAIPLALRVARLESDAIVTRKEYHKPELNTLFCVIRNSKELVSMLLRCLSTSVSKYHSCLCTTSKLKDNFEPL
jgi:hypothetical protein